jgi:hypothetical protein
MRAVRKRSRPPDSVPFRTQCITYADEILKRADLAQSTRRAYQNAFWIWCLWHTGRYGAPLSLPTPVEVVVQFLLDFTAHRLAESTATEAWGCMMPRELDEWLVQEGAKQKLGPWSINTVQLKIDVLNAFHYYAHLPSPTEEPELEEFWELSLARCTASMPPRHRRPRKGRWRSFLLDVGHSQTRVSTTTTGPS